MKALGYIAGMFFAIVLNGWVLSIIWAWFFVTSLNLPVLTIPQAIGVSLVVAFLTQQSTNDDDNETTSEEFVNYLFKSIVRALFFLLVAWIVTLFM